MESRVSFFSGVWHGLDEAFFMFWETLWALVLGFALSGAVQAFVSRTEMQRALGDHRPATLAKSSFFGVISSSCSYASSALAKTLFARGADFTAAMVFMIASTNLVVELGHRAVAADRLAVRAGRVRRRRDHDRAARAGAAAGDPASAGSPTPAPPEPRTAATGRPARHATAMSGRRRRRADEPDRASADPQSRGWGDASGYTISDLTMLRKELVIGFVVAGFLAALVPNGVLAARCS